MIQNLLKSGRKYWATHSSTHSFARIAHSLAFSALLASLARSTVLVHSLARSLIRSRAHGKAVFVYEMNASISYTCNLGSGSGQLSQALPHSWVG